MNSILVTTSGALSLLMTVAAIASESNKSDNPTTEKIGEGKEREFEIKGLTTVKMCWIPAGGFIMGSPEGELGRIRHGRKAEDEGRHPVHIKKGFWMGKFEVTQRQWVAVMGENPSKFKGEGLPVERVRWEDSREFIEKLNGAGSLPAGWRFDLPTEAEWEYACRAGTEKALNSGQGLTSEWGRCSKLDELGWYRANSGGRTHAVGEKRANAWGLHDMHGNVYEWCRDWYDEYEVGLQVDPVGPADATFRVARGGCWAAFARNCRSANRWGSPVPPDRGADITGLRLVLRAVPEEKAE